MTVMEEEDMDEDVFIQEDNLVNEDEPILRDMEDREALADRLRKSKRPVVSRVAEYSFQQLEIDYVIGESHKGLIPNSSGPAAIWCDLGSCPPGMGPDDISRFHQVLEVRMREDKRNNSVTNSILRVEVLHKKSITYYQQHSSQPFLKIVVALPTMFASCRGILDKGIQTDGIGMKSFMTYESNVLFVLRFMIDCKIVGCNWIEVPAHKYMKTTKNMSYSHLEFDCLYSELISHVPEGEYSKMAPFRISSFDIECAGHKGLFPEPTHDPVIQIANLVTLQGEENPFVRNVMTLNSCSPIVGVDVMSFDPEREVLLAWRFYS